MRRESLMPANLAIAAFVFGAVLLLIALVGGGFKVFGAEVAEKAAGPSTRWASGVLGGSLLAVAFLTQSPSLFPLGGAPGTPNKPDDGGKAAAVQAAVPAPKVECKSGSGAALVGDVVQAGRFLGYKPPVGIIRVPFRYDGDAHPNPVYVRVTVFSGHTRIGEGFARATKNSGDADVHVETQLLDQMESDWAEAVLCTEGRAIRVEQFPLRAPWVPLSTK
jgi:hypothetical protein